MAPTLQDLLDHRALGLKLVVAGSEGALDRQVAWVSGSDLPDPTPFLLADQVLLTTGTQFGTAVSTTQVEAYVARLADAGVAGLGFGTEVITAGTPPELAEACAAHGMPLIEVPYRTPFIAVIRYAADLLTEAARARDAWALGAQRAIAFAALRPDATAAVVTELARSLGAWVVLFDAHATPVAIAGDGPTAGPETERLLERVAGEATMLLSRGQRSGATLASRTRTVSLQTLGRRGDLRGVLAIAGTDGPLDAAAQSVVTSVVAIAGLTLEQGGALGRAGRSLRTGVWQLLRAGQTPAAREVAEQLGTPLPTGAVRVGVCSGPTEGREALLTELERAETLSPGSLFVAEQDGRPVLLLAAAEGDTETGVDRAVEDVIAAAPARRLGLSRAVALAELTTGIEQAVSAHEHAVSAGEAVVRFGALAAAGMAGLLDPVRAAAVAEELLEPVLRVDREEGSDLVPSLRGWLEANGQWEPAARRLGIHRHTLRNRITRVEQVLGRPLDTFAARAELWLALVSLSDGDALRSRAAVL
ncbi:PucR family transcriptional regulator [Plantibacter flavus]|uniref:PucR family transcriptional regulator n=1 Tax=Plantibacter flavus TaxID=150123 RepID=UPI0010C19FCA|nr:PucR family transcriptional regulator [Plantibacter flavus]TKJ99146.1 PucR family transcriptional regulator [Plantibacter flavus]